MFNELKKKLSDLTDKVKQSASKFNQKQEKQGSTDQSRTSDKSESATAKYFEFVKKFEKNSDQTDTDLNNINLSEDENQTIINALGYSSSNDDTANAKATDSAKASDSTTNSTNSEQAQNDSQANAKQSKSSQDNSAQAKQQNSAKTETNTKQDQDSTQAKETNHAEHFFKRRKGFEYGKQQFSYEQLRADVARKQARAIRRKARNEAQKRLASHNDEQNLFQTNFRTKLANSTKSKLQYQQDQEQKLNQARLEFEKNAQSMKEQVYFDFKNSSFSGDEGIRSTKSIKIRQKIERKKQVASKIEGPKSFERLKRIQNQYASAGKSSTDSHLDLAKVLPQIEKKQYQALRTMLISMALQVNRTNNYSKADGKVKEKILGFIQEIFLSRLTTYRHFNNYKDSFKIIDISHVSSTAKEDNLINDYYPEFQNLIFTCELADSYKQIDEKQFSKICTDKQIWILDKNQIFDFLIEMIDIISVLTEHDDIEAFSQVIRNCGISLGFDPIKIEKSIEVGFDAGKNELIYNEYRDKWKDKNYQWTPKYYDSVTKARYQAEQERKRREEEERKRREAEERRRREEEERRRREAERKRREEEERRRREEERRRQEEERRRREEEERRRREREARYKYKPKHDRYGNPNIDRSGVYVNHSIQFMNSKFSDLELFTEQSLFALNCIIYLASVITMHACDREKLTLIVHDILKETINDRLIYKYSANKAERYVANSINAYGNIYNRRIRIPQPLEEEFVTPDDIISFRNKVNYDDIYKKLFSLCVITDSVFMVADGDSTINLMIKKFIEDEKIFFVSSESIAKIICACLGKIESTYSNCKFNCFSVEFILNLLNQLVGEEKGLTLLDEYIDLTLYYNDDMGDFKDYFNEENSRSNSKIVSESEYEQACRVLEVSTDKSIPISVIKKARRKKVQMFHPDRATPDKKDEYTKKSQEINNAFETIERYREQNNITD